MQDGQRSGLRRRELLVGGAGAGIALAAPLNYAAMARGLRVPVATGGKFAHGVSAGFPSSKGITLWTRVSELSKSSKLTLEVATDKHFKHVVDTQDVVAESNRDYTVHAQVKGLKPREEYFYRFATKHKSSRVGTFRTLPPSDSKEKLRIGYYSCQDYEAGYYNAQAGLAKEKDLDLVICLGDYIYEHMYYPGPSDRVDTLGANGDGDVQSLAEYRSKYRMYQSDKNLQALHAAYPFVSIWDDHEVEDNYAGDQADSASTDPANFENNNSYPRRVPFGDRRKNGYKAFFEAMPRIQGTGGQKNVIYGSVKIGGLAELFLTDQRQYRDQQPCADALLDPCPDEGTPGRTMLGADQKAWFKKAVAKSKATWKLWASEVMVMSLDITPGQGVNQDQWDGYAAERTEILESFVAAGVQNLAVLTGDIHTFFAGNVSTTGRNGGTPVGVELVGGSATSLGIPEALGVPSSTLKALAGNDPHIKFFDFDHRGYTVVELSKKEMKADFKIVDALTPGAKPATVATFQVASGVPQLNQTSGSTRPIYPS
ncbi:MAG: alkaline phosphatase [Solirubrobacterales bacterium]|jgi:alkaline phosphatase D|nr:alkaline phosphatase [Solirubrobacterales bacterium]